MNTTLAFASYTYLHWLIAESTWTVNDYFRLKSTHKVYEYSKLGSRWSLEWTVHAPNVEKHGKACTGTSMGMRLSLDCIIMSKPVLCNTDWVPLQTGSWKSSTTFIHACMMLLVAVKGCCAFRTESKSGPYQSLNQAAGLCTYIFFTCIIERWNFWPLRRASRPTINCTFVSTA